MTTKIKALTTEQWNQVVYVGNNVISANVFAMLSEPDRWTRVLPDKLVFQHDTGMLVQLRMKKERVDCGEIVVWMDGMTPFQLTNWNEDLRKNVSSFFYQMRLKDAKPTIEKIGVIAALAAPPAD